MHTASIRFEIPVKGVRGRELLGLIQDYFDERKLEPLRFAIVKAARGKAWVEAVVMVEDAPHAHPKMRRKGKHKTVLRMRKKKR
ncbi:MAG: hypothetical protein V1676_04035 [Candidatus Diapherotrites archaeon]